MLSRAEQDALVFGDEPQSMSSSLIEDADCWEEKFPSESAMTRSETWSGPQAFLCPITHEIMREPVILVSDGITYEKCALTAWLDDGNRTSPFTGAELSSSEYRVNFALKNSIEETLKRASKQRSSHAASGPSGRSPPHHRHKSSVHSQSESKSQSLSGGSMKLMDKVESSGLCLDSDAREILTQCDLMFFQSVFIKEGFLTLEDFTRITLVDLLSMNVPRGYCRRLLSAINDYTMPEIMMDDRGSNKLPSSVIPSTTNNGARRSMTGIRRLRSDSTSDEKVASDAGEFDEIEDDNGVVSSVPKQEAYKSDTAVLLSPAALSRKKSRKKIELFLGSSLVPPPSLDHPSDKSSGIVASKEKLNVNIILLGDANTGKTTLRKRMALNDYVLSEPTTGVECSFVYGEYLDTSPGLSSSNTSIGISTTAGGIVPPKKTATKYRIHATIWDPAGQERYAPITKSFFRKCHAAAVIFSPDDPHSWKSVEYWLRELDENAPDDIEVCLVCNKSDLILGPLTEEGSTEEVIKDDTAKPPSVAAAGSASAGISAAPATPLKSVQSSDQCYWSLIDKATRIANERRIPFYCCSAKTGECVLEAFEGLLEHTLLNQIIMNNLTQSWVHVPSSIVKEYHRRGYGESKERESAVMGGTGKMAWKDKFHRLKHASASKLKRGSSLSDMGRHHSSGLGWSEEGSILRLTGRNKDGSPRQAGSPIVRCGCQ